MTIAVHEPSNSLIVTAPESLLVEVEKLAMSIDARGRQTIEVVAPLNGDLIESVLQEVLLGAPGGPPRGRSFSGGGPSPAVPGPPRGVNKDR